MPYAQIIDGRVAALTDEPAPYSPLVEAGPEVQVGWLFLGGQCAPPPEPTLAEAKAAKQAEIIAGADALLNALAVNYSAGEKLSWPKQEAEALSLAADAEAPAPLLRGIAAIRGIALADLRDKVLANVAEYEQATAFVLGTQQHLADLLAAASTVEEVQAIVVDYA
ncbi:MAG: hypothetical protein AB9900_10925 [Humidesulfovibrio sp.]